MRIAFTIIYNGDHHLRHNDYVNKIPKMFDYWVVVEGLALPGGSTSWCRDMSRNGFYSIDSTVALLTDCAEVYDNVGIVIGDRPWVSKDEMVNKALSVIKSEIGIPDGAFLWQIDVDEQWELKDLEASEEQLLDEKANCGCFHADYWLGRGIKAVGEWGEGNAPDDPLRNAYRRLWLWNGDMFKCHEPPTLEAGNGKEILIDRRFQHYAYFYEKDVVLKNLYYQGHEDIYTKWLKLQNEIKFPQPISYLISGSWGKSATQIVHI